MKRFFLIISFPTLLGILSFYFYEIEYAYPPILASERNSRTFKEKQNSYRRVRAARREKEGKIIDTFSRKNIKYPPSSALLIVYKMERVVELWAADNPNENYTHIKDYTICMLSGLPGPKRREGDLQIPEGFYKIIAFNPVSSYHLSMKINYPNRSDRILSDKNSPGGLIFIHGSCVTIGCIPITDDFIKELYIIAVDTYSKNGRQIPVYIFPSRLTDKKMQMLMNIMGSDHPLIKFWTNLKEGYDKFIKEKRPLQISVDSKGRYLFR